MSVDGKSSQSRSLELVRIFFYYYLNFLSHLTASELSSLTRDQTWSPALEVWSLNHWATGELRKDNKLKLKLLTYVHKQLNWGQSPAANSCTSQDTSRDLFLIASLNLSKTIKQSPSTSCFAGKLNRWLICN